MSNPWFSKLHLFEGIQFYLTRYGVDNRSRNLDWDVRNLIFWFLNCCLGNWQVFKLQSFEIFSYFLALTSKFSTTLVCTMVPRNFWIIWRHKNTLLEEMQNTRFYYLLKWKFIFGFYIKNTIIYIYIYVKLRENLIKF